MLEMPTMRVREPRAKPRPVACPQTSPLINIMGIAPGSHTLRFADSRTPYSGAKPFGATELQVFVAISDKAEAQISEARYYGKFTKNPAIIEFDARHDGKIATYYARWVSRRGENGPWSLPVVMRIAV